VTHDELRQSLEAWALGALRPTEATEVERHLSTCETCRELAAPLLLVPVVLASAAPDAAPSDAVRERLVSRIGAVRADIPSLSVLSGPSVVRPPRRASAVLPWLAAAAALLVAAVLGWDGVRLRGRIAELTRALEQERAASAATEARLALLQRTSDQQRSAFAVLVAPDVARIDLAGQPDAPGARGRAFWSRSRGMVFSATALPPPPPGRTYQVWVVTSQPAPISAGLVQPDPDGFVNAVFATPPDIPQPVAVAVTLEPAGGVPSPTGPKVLVGTV
jgi:anti-sigma-K factor RskA